jgi:hypothetical protein
MKRKELQPRIGVQQLCMTIKDEHAAALTAARAKTSGRFSASHTHNERFIAYATFESEQTAK